jgi:hypothetical protein
MRRVIISLVLLASVFCASAQAQPGSTRGQQNGVPQIAVAPVPAEVVAYSINGTTPESSANEVQIARTARERFQDYRSQTFSPWALFAPAVGAGVSQWRNYPSEWKQGGEGFGKRLASGYGSAVLENTISFGVSTFDHEDLRYPLSTYPKNAILKRAGHAFAYTFVPKKEGGGRRFGWSRLIGAYGSGFIANTWYPARHSDTPNALYLGSTNLAGDLGINLLKEFIRPHVEFGNTKKASNAKKEEDKHGN